MSERAHLEQVAKIRGETPDGLVEPEISPDATHIWEIFLDIHRGRTYGMSANPLTWTDIHNWCILFGVDLTPWQVDTIKMIDMVWIRVANEDKNG